MSTANVADATKSLIRQTSPGQRGRDPVQRAAKDVRHQMSGDNEKKGNKKMPGAKRKDYKGFVAGVFSGIAKLSGE